MKYLWILLISSNCFGAVHQYNNVPQPFNSSGVTFDAAVISTPTPTGTWSWPTNTLTYTPVATQPIGYPTVQLVSQQGGPTATPNPTQEPAMIATMIQELYQLQTQQPTMWFNVANQFTQVPQNTQIPVSAWPTQIPYPGLSPTATPIIFPTQVPQFTQIPANAAYTQIPVSAWPTQAAQFTQQPLATALPTQWVNVANPATPIAQFTFVPQFTQVVGYPTQQVVSFVSTPQVQCYSANAVTLAASGVSLLAGAAIIGGVSVLAPVTLGGGATIWGGGPVTIGAATIFGGGPLTVAAHLVTIGAGTDLMGYVGPYAQSYTKSVSATGMGVTTANLTYPCQSWSVGITTISGTGSVTLAVYAAVNKTYSGFISVGAVSLTGGTSAVTSVTGATTWPFYNAGVSTLGTAASTTITQFLSVMQ